MSTEIGILQDKNIGINNNFKNIQEKFLNSTLGKVINNALDIGLRSILPDLVEEDIINIKDTILESGFSEGINEAISTAINFGKSAIGIITGQFENTNQIEIAIKKGGIIDSVSDLLDFSLKKANENGIIDKSVCTLIKNGKNTILNTVVDKIENTLETQVKDVEKIQKYCSSWNEYYNNQDFEKMESAYKNIEKYLEKTIPIENIIKEARKIENLHNLIKNNGGDFNITKEEIKLSEILVN